MRLALSIIKKFEGLSLEAYQDIAGVWTIGYGRTHKVKKGDTCTKAQADRWLQETVQEYYYDVRRLAPKANDYQYAAMTSLAYNIGLVAFKRSSVLRFHNMGNHARAADSFLLWNKVTIGGQKITSKGLTNRRLKERDSYLRWRTSPRSLDDLADAHIYP